MKLRLSHRWFVPVAVLIAAVRCGGESLQVDPGGACHSELISGDGQSAVVQHVLTDSLVVRVTNCDGGPVKDQDVDFVFVAGGTAATLIPATAPTNTDGLAKAAWVLGTLAGQQRVEARVKGVSTNLVFNATGLADVADTVFAVKGDSQAGVVSRALTDSLAVLVTDQYGNPVAGTTVSWAVPVGQGTVSAAVTVTGPDGRAAVVRTLGPTAGRQTATATSTGLKGSPVTFVSTAVSGNVTRLVKLFGDTTSFNVAASHQTAPAGNRLTDSMVVQAQDALGNGVAGQNVVWVVTSGGGSFGGGSNTTDANGKAYTFWTTGTTAGPNTMTAALPALPQVQFTATGIAAQASKIAANSAVAQTDTVGLPVAVPPSVKVTDINNNPVQGVTVTFTIASGGGTVSDGTGSGPTATVATNSLGVATVASWTLGNLPGANSVTASAVGTGGAPLTGSPVTFNATGIVGSPVKLAFGVQPTNVVAGAAITPAVTVLVQDVGGNTVTTSTAPVTIAIGTNPGSSTLGGTLTVNAVAGVATFSNLSLNKVGTGYTLSATSGSLTAATSTAFNVTFGVPNKLAFAVQPSTAAAGVAIAPAVQVQVQDVNGNVVTTSTATVTVAIGTNPGSSTLSGTTSVNAVAGVATFSNLSLNKVGSGYTLTAASTVPATLIGATSTGFNVTTAPAFSIAVSAGNNQSATVGTAVAIPPAVLVSDALGNPVPGVNVTFAVATGGGTVNPTTAVATNASGIATVTSWTLGTVSGTNNNTLTATSAGLSGSPVTFTASGTPGTGTKLSFNVQPASVAAGAAIAPAVVVQMLDNSNNVVTSFTGQVTMSIGTNPGSSTLSGTTAVNAVAGVATFSALTLNKVGTGYTLVASATGATSATSTGFNVTPGAANKLAFGVQPAASVAGAAISPAVTVQVLDANDNLVTTSTATVTMAIGTNPGGGTLGGTVSVNAAAGIATFSALNINKSGTGYTLVASSTVPATLTSATSTGFNVTAGAANKLAFAVQPSSANGGAVIAPPIQVQVQDVNGNLVTTSTATVTMAIGTNPAAGVLTGTTSVAAVGGIATFSTLKIDKAGTGYTLVASSTVPATLASATSTAFNITVGNGSLLVFTTQPTSAVSQTAIAPAIVVTVQDAGGNTVTTDASQITLAINSNPGGGNLSGTLTATASAGVATFSNVRIDKIGTGYTLTALVLSGGPTPGTSAPFNITPGIPASLAFLQQPSNVGAVAAITPAVSVRLLDAAGNLTTSTNTVTLAIGTNPGGGTPSNNSVAAVAGVATFPALSIDKAGTGYTLVASSSGAGTATSTAFNVTAGAASKVIFAQQPTNSVVGATLSPAVTAQIQDAGGNLVTTSTATVTVAIGTNPGGATLGGTLGVAAVGGIATFSNLTLTKVGTGYTLTAASAGLATGTSSAFNITASSTTTTITTDTPDPSVVGQGYTAGFTVAAVAPGTGTPTGNVTVSDGAASCSAALVSGAGSCTLTSTTVGAKTLTATYAGDGNYATSSGTMGHTVNAATTTTTISNSVALGTASVTGQGYAVTYTVAPVAPGAGTPTGNVTVSDGAASCTATVAAGTCTLTSTAAGAKTITATFAGDGNYTGSTSTGVAHTVNVASTTTAITNSVALATASVTGQGYAVTYTVAPVAPGAGTPTGNVTVSDGAATCTGTVAAGTCTLTSTSAGAKTITATYATDGNYAGSTSTGVAHTVNKANTTTAITSDNPDPSSVGSAYTVTYTVAAAAPGAGTPTGNVTVSDGTDSCTGTVAAGSCSLTSSTTGTKTLTATYAGDVNFNTSSGTTSHVVGASGTTTTITGDSPDPSVVGQAATVTFTVTGGSTTPTGNVTVSDGVSSCIGALTGGVGSCGLAMTTTGAKTITATYAGDGSHSGSTSVGVSHTVNPASTTTSVLTDTPDPSVVGQAVTVTYSVAASAPGSGTPTGNVTVSDGAASCTGTVAAGTCALTPTTAGAKTLTATYAGDANYNTSSGTTPHQVNTASTTTTITNSVALASASTVNAAYAVTWNVAVTAPGAGTPTGNVTVSDGAATCSAAVATGTCNLTSTTSGTKTVTATYAGDANFATSTSAGVSHPVNSGTTTTTITNGASLTTATVVGQGYAVNYSVTSGSGTPTGNVTVSDGAATCTATVAAGTCNLTSTTAAAKTITATYAGDANFAGSASTGVPHTVNKASTTTTITNSGALGTASTVNVAYPVTWSVAVTAPGAGAPTGNVTVSDGTATCTAAVAAGTCNLTSTSTGTKTITATYAGDANFNTSASTGVSHTVNPATTTTTISNDGPDPSVVGQTVTISYSVTGGTTTPGGSVTVSDGTQSCSAALVAGAASCTIAFTTVGARNLTATYGGDATHAGSVSLAAAHSVNQAATTTTIQSSNPDPSGVGVQINVVFTVSPNAPGAGTPTGNVTVADGLGGTCTATVLAGSCLMIPGAGSAGPITLTATYAGDTNFVGSTSAGATHTIN